MHTILIAHRNTAFGEQLAGALRAGGYRVITCPGPWPPVQRCIRCDAGYCPLTDGADLLIYDPHLTGRDAQGASYSLAVASALAHPDVPMLLAWPPAEVPHPDTLRRICLQAPHIRLAQAVPEELVQRIAALLAPLPVQTEVMA